MPYKVYEIVTGNPSVDSWGPELSLWRFTLPAFVWGFLIGAVVTGVTFFFLLVK